MTSPGQFTILNCGWKARFVPIRWLMLALLLAGGSISANAADEGPPVHQVDGSFVREWLVIGPFLRRDTETDFLAEAGGETGVRPKEGDVVTRQDGVQLSWTGLRSETDLQNPAIAIRIPEFSVAYAYCELNTDQALASYLRAFSRAQGTVWLNGRNIGQISGFIGSKTDIPPALPMKLKPGRNSLLLKLSPQKDGADFLVQPLPLGWTTIDLSVVDSLGKALPSARAQFYSNGELIGRTTVEGETQVCLMQGAYDVRVTSGDLGVWRLGIAVSSHAPQGLKCQLTNAISISGRVLAMNQSPQSAIVVEAIRMAEDEPPPAPKTSRVMTGLGPAFSETVLTDLKGDFRFINLPPGKYRLQCHGPEGFMDPKSGVETNQSGSFVMVEPGRPKEGVVFVFPEAKKGVWKNYQIMEGLKEVQPRSLERTADGMIWIGTDQSFLYAFDGVEFKLAGAAPEIPANEIETLEKGHDGALWVGTFDGIARHAQNQIQAISLPDGGIKKKTGEIFCEPDGRVWFATTSGLFKQEGGTISSIPLKDGHERETINSLLRARDGSLWIGTSSGLLRFDGRSFTLLQPFTGFSSRGVTHLHQAKDDAIWFTSIPGGGAYRYDGRAVTRLGAENGLLSDGIDDITETSDGTLWFATKMGLSRFNGRTIINYMQEDGLSNEWVRDLLVDADDVIWCANGWGLSRFDPKGFIGFGQMDGLDRGLGPSEVFTVEPEPDGNVLIGTGWRGVFRCDGQTLHPLEGFSDGYVRQIHRTANDTLWFGTSTGLLKLERGQLAHVLPRSPVLALCSDNEGNIWYGHGWHGGGVTRYNTTSGQETVFGLGHGLPDIHVWALQSGSDGGVWIGTSSGLARYFEGKIEILPDSRAFRRSGVFHLRRDANDFLWVGGRDGLDCLNGNERVQIAATNPAPGHVWSSAQTADGKIWMATDRHGVLGFDGKAVTMLDKRDGMLGNSAFTLRTNRDNSIWVGFLDGGLTLYRPGKVRPSVRLHSMLVDNQAVTNLAKTPAVAVGHGITFQYQEIDQKTHPEKRQFWYRLARESGELVFAGITRQRRFDWVPDKSGSFSFEIQAIDRDLNYSEPARVLLQVFVPWHDNPWFLVPGIIAFAGLLLWTIIGGLLYLRKRREADRLQERARIARDLHDQLGAGLTHLAMLGDILRQQGDQPVVAQSLAARLSDSAYELSRTMGQVIWATDPAKDTLRSFVSFVSSYAEKYLVGSALGLRLDFPTDLPELPLPAQLRHHLFMVVKEGLNNAVKHAQASQVRIKLELSDDELLLTIQDDGQGFQKNEVNPECHGLANMQKRLQQLGGVLEIETAPGRGTRIHARLPLPGTRGTDSSRAIP